MNPHKFTGRLQSFLVRPDLFWTDHAKRRPTTLDCIDRMASVRGVTHVEPNYPMHFREHSADEVKRHAEGLGLKVSGVALRFEPEFAAGEVTNPESALRDRAAGLIHEAAELCRHLGGTTTTIWSTYDGFDYPFQLDYGTAWRTLVAAYRDVARAHPDMRFSIEYKPYEPRQFYLVNDIGTTLLAIAETGCPNLGVTLDFAHMLMKKENPAYSLALAAERGRLFGFHLNDGYGSHDDGLILGSVSFMQTVEFIHYMRKYQYDDVIFFDTFPLREDPVAELETNIAMFNGIVGFLDAIGEKAIADAVARRDALGLQRMFLLDWLGRK